jgi:hypothetical protein
MEIQQQQFTINSLGFVCLFDNMPLTLMVIEVLNTTSIQYHFGRIGTLEKAFNPVIQFQQYSQQQHLTYFKAKL